MIAECALLGVGAKVIKDAATIEYLKSKQVELPDEQKQDILANENRRFVHFTSEKSAKEIMKAGFLIPTKGILDNHFSKKINDQGKKENSEMVYMFDSEELNIDDYIKNLPRKRSPYGGVYEYYAISMSPNKYNINSFKKRVQDGAITYDGRLDIGHTDTRMVKYVIDLDENDNYTFREIPLNEKYEPSPELLERLKKDKTSSLGYGIKNYALELKKTKEAMKLYRANKDIYAEQIRKKREFAKANRQFIEAEKEKNNIYEQDGKTIVVKNIGFEMVDGKKLQKLAVVGNGFDDGEKRLEETNKVCYIDEFNVQDIEPEVATKYFFNNYEEMLKSGDSEKYIGLPLQDLETGEVVNEYDESFKQHFLKKQNAKTYSQENQPTKQNWLSKMKNFFGRIIKRKSEEPKMLNEYTTDDMDKLNKLGYGSVKEMNAYDPEITILEQTDPLRDNLAKGVWPPTVAENNKEQRERYGGDIPREQKNKDIGE